MHPSVQFSCAGHLTIQLHFLYLLGLHYWRLQKQLRLMRPRISSTDAARASGSDWWLSRY